MNMELGESKTELHFCSVARARKGETVGMTMKPESIWTPGGGTASSVALWDSAKSLTVSGSQ